MSDQDDAMCAPCPRCRARHPVGGACRPADMSDSPRPRRYARSLTPTLPTGSSPVALPFGDAFTRALQAERDELRTRLADVTAAYESSQKDLDSALQQLEDYRVYLEHASERRQREQGARLLAEKQAADAVARAESAERELREMALVTARALLVEVRQLVTNLRAGRLPDAGRGPGDIL